MPFRLFSYLCIICKGLSEKCLQRLNYHPNALAISLLDETDEAKRLKRLHMLDLPFRN